MCRLVEALDTTLHFPQAENSDSVQASPLPTKTVRLCGGPEVLSIKIICGANTFILHSAFCILHSRASALQIGICDVKKDGCCRPFYFMRFSNV